MKFKLMIGLLLASGTVLAQQVDRAKMERYYQSNSNNMQRNQRMLPHFQREKTHERVNAC